MSDFATFSNTVIAFVATYFVHSTLLLAMCWLTVALLRPKSHFLAERLWKLATVLGILTACSQVFIGSNFFDIAMQSGTDGDRLSDVAEDAADFNVNAETVSAPNGTAGCIVST